MSISKRVLDYLKKNDIEVRVEGHKKVYTAYDLAKTMNEKLHKVGKSLLVKVDGKPYLVLVPGHYHLDLGKIKKELKAKKVELANEKNIKKLLNAKPGALHPFTGIHKVELLLDKALLKSKDAIIRAGSFTESLRMKAKDLHKLENATLGEFGKMAIVAAKKAPAKTKKAIKKAKATTKKIKSKAVATKRVVKKNVKKAAKTKAGRFAKKTAKVAAKKVMKTRVAKRTVKKVEKARKKIKKAVKKAVKKSPVKIKISKVPAIKRKRKR